MIGVPDPSFRVQQVLSTSGATTQTVVGKDHLPISVVELFLEDLRESGSPNTVKAYCRGLAQWFQFLDMTGSLWNQPDRSDFTNFVIWLRWGDRMEVGLPEEQPKVSPATVALRINAVTSFYRFTSISDAGLPEWLNNYFRLRQKGGRRDSFLGHLSRGGEVTRPLVRIRKPGRTSAPVFTPNQVVRIKDACSQWRSESRDWKGGVRDRFLLSLLDETGMRLGEALGLQHADWHTGKGDHPFVEIVPREHPHEVRTKGGRYRRLLISDSLDRLYGDLLVEKAEIGAFALRSDEEIDADYVFINMKREPLFQPTRPSTVYALVRKLKRKLGGRVPSDWTPHWFRHTNATAMLLSGVDMHVVSRRLGHQSIQTTIDTYGWVTEDAELRALAGWDGHITEWRGKL